MNTLNKIRGVKYTTTKPLMILYIIIFTFILTSCSQEDKGMHITGEDYLHKELVEETFKFEEVENRPPIKGSVSFGFIGGAKNALDLVNNLNEEATGDKIIESVTQGGNLRLPVPSGIWNSLYGPRTHPITKVKGKFHDGIDIATSGGTPIQSAHDGTIVTKSFCHTGSCGWGNYVVVEGKVNGTLIRTLYAHMQAPSNKKVGDKVKAGDQIGKVGSTGGSTGNHLHLEVMVKDPKRTELKKNITPILFVSAQSTWWYRSGSEWSRLDPMNYLSELESIAQFNTQIHRR